MAERDVQAVGQERDEDVRFDPILALMKCGFRRWRTLVPVMADTIGA
jgi:hypothetical protein